MAFHNRHHEQSTFATALQAVGFRTAMLGKYLNGYEPAKDSPEPGWSMWAVAGNGCPEFNYGLNEDRKVAHYGREPTGYLTDVLSGKAVNCIKQSAGAAFMIEIATFAPHKPYTPAPLKEIVENIDLNPTFNEVGGATTSATVDGLSLVPLLHGEPVAAWRKVALVEHQGPVRNMLDPDFPGVRSGNPTTYEAIRGPTWLYVEYANGEKAYHDLAADPDELHNTYSTLTSDE
jgi:hypothetical protein